MLLTKLSLLVSVVHKSTNMPITSEQLIELCDKLDSDASYSGEIIDRTIVSRNYYAAYHIALRIIDKYALPETVNPRVHGSHNKNLARLAECVKARCDKYTTIKSIGYMATKVLFDRTAADYYIDVPLPFNSKSETISRVKLILEKSKEVL
jgi:protein involved in sex pheromone biosynthesis